MYMLMYVYWIVIWIVFLTVDWGQNILKITFLEKGQFQRPTHKGSHHSDWEFKEKGIVTD